MTRRQRVRVPRGRKKLPPLRLGFTCGYCRNNLETQFTQGESAQAEDFAQAQGWRITLGYTDSFGGNAHVTCPDCLPAFTPAVVTSIGRDPPKATAIGAE